MITVYTIKHKNQRYDTVGDWQFDRFGNLKIKVSKLHDDRYEKLLVIHEIIEAVLCKENGVTEQQVDAWDIEHKDSKDPGSIPGCPYYREHMFATMIERAMAAELNVDWEAYEACLEAL